RIHPSSPKLNLRSRLAQLIHWAARVFCLERNFDMTVSADTICQSGIAYPTAIEIARQMNAGVGNVNALVSSGIPPVAATELVRQINAVSFDSHKLSIAGFHGELATQIKKT